jgi:hypothetical protein
VSLIGLGLLHVRHYVALKDVVIVAHQLIAALHDPWLQGVKLNAVEVDRVSEVVGPLPRVDHLFVFVLKLDVLVQLCTSEKVSCHLNKLYFTLMTTNLMRIIKNPDFYTSF